MQNGFKNDSYFFKRKILVTFYKFSSNKEEKDMSSSVLGVKLDAPSTAYGSEAHAKSDDACNGATTRKIINIHFRTKMCPDANACKKGDTCSFAHSAIQLNRMLCIDFMHDRCSRPVCKRVHVTVFEHLAFINANYQHNP